MNKSAWTIIPALCFSGCVTVPKTSSELIETSSTTQSYRYSLPTEEVAKRVAALRSHCYGPVETVVPAGKAVYVPIAADFDVLSGSLPDGVRYSVRNFVGCAYRANIVNGVPG